MTVDPELARLLANSLFVRSVARGLLSRDQDLEEVVQETWLAALRAPPRSPRSRSWLRRVVRNLASNLHRGAERRARREQTWSPLAPIPSPDEILHQEDVRRSVVEAVLSLPEPQRTTVLLRHFEGRSIEDVARALGVPEETVKTRLRRAHAELRTRMTEKHGEPSSWMPALATLAGDWRLVGTVAGGIAMTMKTKWLAATLILLFASAASVSWWHTRRTRMEQGHATTIASASAAPGPAAQDTPLQTTAREELVRLEAEPPAALAADDAAETGEAVLDGRFMDPSGAPVAGVAVTPQAESDVMTTSDERGSFRWTVPTPAVDAGDDPLIKYGSSSTNLRDKNGTVHLHARKAGFVAQELSSVITFGSTVSLGPVTLEPAGSVAGRVLDEDGHPFAGATVLVADVERPGPGVALGPTRAEVPISWFNSVKTQPDGSFRIDDIRPGWIQVWARAAGYFYTGTSPSELIARHTLEPITITLARITDADAIEGRVLGPDGAGVAEARVLFWQRTRYEGLVIADGDGHFRYVVNQRVPHHVQVMAPGERFLSAQRDGVEPGTRDLVFRLKTAPSFRVAALDPEKVPIPLFKVAMLWDGELRSETAPAATVLLHAIDEVFSLRVSAMGFAPTDLGPFDATNLPPVIEATLRRLPAFAGRITADGRAIPGAKVSLLLAPPPSTLFSVERFLSRLSPDRMSHAITGTDGRYQLKSDAEGVFFIRAEAPSLAATDAGPFECRAGLDDVTCDLSLTPGGILEGHVLMPAGETPESALIAISCGDGFPQTARVKSDGSYRFENLTPGRWLVQRAKSEIRPGEGSWGESPFDVMPALPWNCIVAEGKVTRYDLDLTVPCTCTLRGELQLEEAHALPFFVTLVRAGQLGVDPTRVEVESESRSRATVAGDGCFTMSVDEPGVYDLFLEADDGRQSRRFRETITLKLGEQSWRGPTKH
jgi:RNA polymerase sigma-70 factor (ECF subfamily)